MSHGPMSKQTSAGAEAYNNQFKDVGLGVGVAALDGLQRADIYDNRFDGTSLGIVGAGVGPSTFLDIDISDNLINGGGLDTAAAIDDLIESKPSSGDVPAPSTVPRFACQNTAWSTSSRTVHSPQAVGASH